MGRRPPPLPLALPTGIGPGGFQPCLSHAWAGPRPNYSRWLEPSGWCGLSHCAHFKLGILGSQKKQPLLSDRAGLLTEN